MSHCLLLNLSHFKLSSCKPPESCCFSLIRETREKVKITINHLDLIILLDEKSITVMRMDDKVIDKRIYNIHYIYKLHSLCAPAHFIYVNIYKERKI